MFMAVARYIYCAYAMILPTFTTRSHTDLMQISSVAFQMGYDSATNTWIDSKTNGHISQHKCFKFTVLKQISRMYRGFCSNGNYNKWMQCHVIMNSDCGLFKLMADLLWIIFNYTTDERHTPAILNAELTSAELCP